MTEHNLCRVPPFGNLGVKDRMHLVRAYRSWPRPSSLSGAKASTLHPLLPHQKMIKLFRLPECNPEISGSDVWETSGGDNREADGRAHL